jgi:hypothetical protein
MAPPIQVLLRSSFWKSVLISCTHNVANRSLSLVTKTVTKIVTIMGVHGQAETFRKSQVFEAEMLTSYKRSFKEFYGSAFMQVPWPLRLADIDSGWACPATIDILNWPGYLLSDAVVHPVIIKA